jgi:hypothetical protein
MTTPRPPATGLEVFSERTGARMGDLTRDQAVAHLLHVLVDMSYWALSYHTVEWTDERCGKCIVRGEYFLLIELARDRQAAAYSEHGHDRPDTQPLG